MNAQQIKIWELPTDLKRSEAWSVFKPKMDPSQKISSLKPQKNK